MNYTTPSIDTDEIKIALIKNGFTFRSPEFSDMYYDEKDCLQSALLFLESRGMYDACSELLLKYEDELSDLPEAKRIFGEILCMKGTGTVQDEDKGHRLLEAAYENGSPRAGYGLGHLIYKEDPVKAASLIRMAAFNGDSRAQREIAEACHDDNHGLETQDRRQEMFWREYEMRKIHSEDLMYHAYNMIEKSYDIGFPPTEINTVLEKAAAFGSADAKRHLAAYYYGLENPSREDLIKALYWLTETKSSGEYPGWAEKKINAIEEKLGIGKEA